MKPTPDDFDGFDNANAADGEYQSLRDRLEAIRRLDDDEAEERRIPVWVQRARESRLPAKVEA